MEPGSRRSPDEDCLQLLESRTESGSRRSPGGVFLLSALSAESGSRRSPGEDCLQLLESRTESGSRRSPDGDCL